LTWKGVAGDVEDGFNVFSAPEDIFGTSSIVERV
jgi:hypothetical protein